MKKIFTIITSLLLFTLVGCSQQRDNIQDLEQKDFDGTITLTTHAPGWDLDTRAMVSEQEGSLNLISSFKATDKVRLFIVQGDKIYDLKDVEFASLSEDKQVAKLTITLPTEVDATKPVDIIGYNGLNQRYLKMVEGSPRISISAFLHTDIEKFNAPVYFRIKDMVPAEDAITDMDVKFQHLGAYEIVHFENKSDNTIKGRVTLSEVSSYGPKVSWAYKDGYDSAQGGTVYYQYDIIKEEVIATTDRISYEFYTEPDINPNETKSVISWVFPREGVNMPNMVIDFYNRSSQSANNQSKGMIPAKSYGMEVGKVYHAYGYWDGQKVVCIDPENNEPRPTPYISVTTDIEVGKNIEFKTYVPYGSSKDSWMDLNNNGIKDDFRENAPKNFQQNRVTVQDPKITFHGGFESLEIPKQGITSVSVSPVAPIVQLDLSENKLSAEALNSLFEQLPDISHIEADVLTPKTLKIDGNPGADECNAKIAAKKGWILDIIVIDDSQPYVIVDLGTYGSKEFYVTIDAAKDDQANVWIDLNGDAEMADSEKITRFGLLSKINASNNKVVFYGDISKLDFVSAEVFAYYGGTNTKLKYLNLAKTGAVAVMTQGHPNLEFLNVNGNKLYTDIVPFHLATLTKLKVLDLGNCETGDLDFSNNKELTYLNVEGNKMNVLNISAQPNLKQLICSTNSLKALDISKATGLLHLEVTQNELPADQVNSIINALPNRTGMSKGGFWIANNPGTGAGDFHIATSKNWTVDARNSKADNKLRRPIMEGEDW